jgi:hypothetical protein
MKADYLLIELLRLYKKGVYSEENMIATIERDYETAEAIGHGKGVLETLRNEIKLISEK